MTRAPTAGPSRPLATGHFRRVAEHGFGDGVNAYAYSTAWFRDHLYVGSNRHTMPLVLMQATWDVSLEPPPVPLMPMKDMDLRGQIWRYSPAEEKWTLAYRAPLIRVGERDVPLFLAFRCMTVFQGTSDPEPAIYTLPIQGRYAPRRSILRSFDGEHFEELPQPRLPEDPVEWRSFRGVVPFKSRLFVAPASSQVNPSAAAKADDPQGLQTLPNTAAGASVRYSADPASGVWEASSLPHMGEGTNLGLFDLAVFGDRLYVGTMNVREGFQLWCTDGEGPGPHRWEKVLDHGADRGILNQCIMCMAEFQGALYFGSCIQNGGHDKRNNIGPAAGEVSRVKADGSWDLVMGQPRQTRDGLKVPLSGHGPGFDNPFAGYIWRMCVHDGALYVGTGEMTPMIPYTDRSRWPEHARRLCDRASIELFMKLRGGAELWRTTDGERWAPVTRNGFGNRYNMGIRGLISTPAGLFVGTANPFGPQIAVEGPGGWSYQPNPRGGLEIWHGSLEHAGFERLGEPPADEALSTVGEEGGEPSGDQWEHAVGDFDSLLWEACGSDPILRMGLAEPHLGGPAATVLAEVGDYYGGVDARSVGYWSGDASTPADASRRLVLELARPLLEEWPEALELELSVLGQGNMELVAALAALDERLRPSAGAWADDRLVSMGEAGVSLAQGDASLDAVVWVEGPADVGLTRALEEVGRVLRPGGRLRAAEALGTGPGADPDLADAGTYRRALSRSCLVEIAVEDVTDQTWEPFFSHSRRFFLARFLLQQIDEERRTAALAALPGGDRTVSTYVVASAVRPAGPLLDPPELRS
ncbi:MAG: hypothetical protein CMJ84_11865 [Planctomycetes bacterium]|nr:hypothetical protein [Planctomycetota bacterium]MDP6409645.1 class I SAM-dependent methyltransferase [Planctomycetota bacterium]